jgi:glucokinase
MERATIGVDFGGTTLEAGLVEGGRVVRALSAPTPRDAPPEATMEALVELVKRLEPRPAAVGLGLPGEVDSEGRCIRLPNVPGFEGVPIAEELRERLSCPVRVENDATAAALGELRHGAGRRHASFVLFTLGTGVGGGVVLDSVVRRGSHGFAGEIGHVLVDSGPSAWPCGCGRRGCLEAYAGTAGLQRAHGLGSAPASPPPSPEAIARAARAGDERALRAFESMGRALGLALASVQVVLDLDAAVFTGGLSASFDLAEPAAREALRERAYAPVLGELPFELSELGGRAGVVGAAELVR